VLVGGAVLANSAKRLDLPARDMLQHNVKFVERSIALDGVEWGGSGLGEHQGFAHRLFPRSEIGEEGITPARAIRLVIRALVPAGAAPRGERRETAKYFFEAPVEQVDQGVGVRERRGDRLCVQELGPTRADLRALGAQGMDEFGLHGGRSMLGGLPPRCAPFGEPCARLVARILRLRQLRFLSRLLGFHPANGVPNQRRGVLQFELLLDMTAVHIDRLRTEVKLLGDVTRALALADELKNLKLAIG
jgi:hypothetical protein